MPKRKGPMKGVQRGVNKANVSLKSMAAVLDQQSQTLQQLTDNSAQVQDDKSGGGGATLIAIQVARAQLALQKESNDYLKKIQASQNKQIEALQKSNKDWKGMGDKLKDFKGKISDAFDVGNIKKKLLGPFAMFKGVRDKIEDIDYAKRMKALGSKKSDKELKADSQTQRGHKEDALRAQDQVDRLKRMGATDDQINQSDAMKQRNASLASYNQLNQVSGKSAKDANNPMGGNTQGTTAPPPVSDINNKMGGNPSLVNPSKDAASQHENQLESIKILNAQTDLLQQIANNTSKGGDNSAAGGKEDTGDGGGGGGILGGIGLGLKALGSGLKSLGTGAGKGIESLLRGLARGVMALANPAALVGLGAFTLAMMGLGKALQMAAPAIDALAPILMKFADVVGDTFIAAIKALPDIIGAVGDVIVNVIGAIGDVITNTMDAVTNSITQLSQIDGDNLLAVGAGLLAVSGGLVAFAASNVVAGISNLVTGFLNLGGDSPIDQLLKLANSANDLNSAAQGIGAIGEAMRSFSNVDPKQMQAINDFPWVRATAFVAAGGAMSVSGAKVYSQSKGNADESAKADGQSKAAAAPSVNTAVQNNQTTNTTVKPNIRNQESSQSRYMSARY
jgi:hypothetical protein